MKNLSQERASFALEKAKNIQDNNKKKYATYAIKLPALITTNGLIPTLAFLKSKSEANPVYDTINEWLQRRKFINNNEDCLEKFIDIDFSTLRLATLEVLAFANWLKRMVEIEIG